MLKCVLYSVDSIASQQRVSPQLQDIEDTSNYSTFTWMMSIIHDTVRT